MIGVEELAALVGQRVKLRRIGNRFVGRCCFHGPDRHPSFNIFPGRDGKARWSCFSCGARGDVIDWQRKVLGHFEHADACKPDPAVELEREKRHFAEIEWQALLDRDPELPEEARLFIEPDLRESLRRRLRSS